MTASRNKSLIEGALRSFVHQNDDGFILCDTDLNILLINDSAKTILKENFKFELAEGMYLLRGVEAERKKNLEQIFSKVTNGVSQTFELNYPSDDDSLRWISVRSNPVRDEDDSIIAVSLQLHDITREMDVEQKAIESTEKLQYALHGLGDHAWSHDFRTGVTWFSSSVNPFVGVDLERYTPEQRDKLWWKSTDPEYRHLLEESDFKYRNAKQDRHHLEYCMTDAKGKKHWVLDRGIAVEKDKEGNPLLVVGTHVDITEIKELQNRLFAIQQEQKKKIVDTVIRSMELDRKDIATELHENINQVLTAAKMMLEFIPIKDHEMALYTEKIQHIVSAAVEEVNKMCNDINPDSLNHVPLLSLVDDLVYRWNREKSVKVEVDKKRFKGQAHRNTEIELTFLRFIQDILYRVTHFSQATACTVTLSDAEGELFCSIDFDDKKFDLLRLSKNLKVVNLQNRVEHYGGSFEMKKDKKGVQFKISMPFA